MYNLRTLLAVTFSITIGTNTVVELMLFVLRHSLEQRLRTKTSHAAHIIVSIINLNRYLNQLYSLIADNLQKTTQRLSAYFVAEHCKFF